MYGKNEIGLYREVIYYDYGQIELAQILLSVFNTIFSNVEFRKIETNQYKLSQVADLVCTVEAIAQKAVLTKSESEFFHSRADFKKNIYKNIVRKNCKKLQPLIRDYRWLLFNRGLRGV